MAKDKDRALNPATAQRKLEKQKALKKGKTALQTQRNTRLASRNPARLESQIADLRSLPAPTARDKKQLEDAERELGRVRKAREVLGKRAPRFTKGGGDGGGRGVLLGKKGRRKEEEWRGSGSETDESVRRVPWPRDTPPPVPRPQRPQHRDTGNANLMPLGSGRGGGERVVPAEAQVPIPAQTVYAAEAKVRDLRAEAVRAFVPDVVRRKVLEGRGEGGRLLEEEEVGKLEREGYVPGVGGERVKGGGDPRTLDEEEEAFRREVGMGMEVEEVGDEEQGL